MIFIQFVQINHFAINPCVAKEFENQQKRNQAVHETAIHPGFASLRFAPGHEDTLDLGRRPRDTEKTPRLVSEVRAGIGECQQTEAEKI